MRHEIKKSVNKAKASMAQRRGPVQKSQERAPIADAIEDYWRRDMLTFGIPAHNGGRGRAPGVSRLLGIDVGGRDPPGTPRPDTPGRALGVPGAAPEPVGEGGG